MAWFERWFGRCGQTRRTTVLSVEPLEARDLLCAPETAPAFVAKLYPDLLRRPVDAPSLQFWADTIDHGASHFAVAQAIVVSPEYRSNALAGYYTAYLGRPVDPLGQTFFQNSLAAGATLEQVQAAILGSPEYYQAQGGGTDDGFLNALFQDTLGRDVDGVGLAFFRSVLASGATRVQAAEIVFGSPEYRTRLIHNVYQDLLDRPADPAGISFFLGAFQGGARTETVLAAVAGTDAYSGGASTSGAIVLTPHDVCRLLQRAAAASPTEDGIIAIVDRGGNLLGVRTEVGVSPAVMNDVATRVFAIDGAISKARTAAFFANNTAPLTSRTVQFISQTTITQREVESNPSIADVSSTQRGPGFVAPVGLGGHFPPNVPNTPPVDLFGIEHTNRDTTVKNGVVLPSRFNVPDQFVPPGVDLTPPDSYGFISGQFPAAQPRGIATLPGGIPIYKFGELVGGIGVFFPGQTGFATAENSQLSTTFNPALPDRSFEAEYIAFAAVGGSAAAGASVGTLGGVAPLAGFGLPFGRIDLAGITLDIFGPGGVQGPQNLMNLGRFLPQGNPNSGVNQPVAPGADAPRFRTGRPVPSGWLVLPHDGVGITAADVVQIVTQGIVEANLTRAQIRLPIGERTRMVFAVADQTGAVLGLFRMPDATVFSIDVAVAKARNVAYYANPGQLQPADYTPGVLPGAAFTSRTFRYLAQPRFPEGIDGTLPAPFSILRDGGVNPTNGLTVGPPLPASAFQSVLGFDAFNPGTNFRAPTSILNQNGVVFFPGSSAAYKDLNRDGLRDLVGGLGVSGDGVDQDDLVTSVAITHYTPPPAARADQFFVQGVRLPYFKFPRNPHA